CRHPLVVALCRLAPLTLPTKYLDSALSKQTHRLATPITLPRFIYGTSTALFP
ncbi:Hexokinase HKDC1, partial [Dissostichus eleginoides]